MKNFIEATVCGGGKVLIPVENIEAVHELYESGGAETFIAFKVGRNGFEVCETFSEVVAKIEAATAPETLTPEAKDALTALHLTIKLTDYKFTDEPADYKRGFEKAVDWCLDIINEHFGVQK